MYIHIKLQEFGISLIRRIIVRLNVQLNGNNCRLIAKDGGDYIKQSTVSYLVTDSINHSERDNCLLIVGS